MPQIVSVILMIIGLALIIPSLVLYMILNKMERKMTPDQVVMKLFKKKIPNASARLDLTHVILLGVLILGLGLLLGGIISGISANVNG